MCEDDDGYLPTNLCINGIATSIYTNAASRVRDIAHGLPRVRRAFGDTSSNFWNPSTFVDDADLSLCAIQGYLPQIYRVDQGWDHDRSPPWGRLYDRANPAGRGGRDNGRQTPRDWNSRPNGRDGGRPRLHLPVTARSTRTGTVRDFSQMSNVKRVSGSDI
jgi:hypothetical protein